MQPDDQGTQTAKDKSDTKGTNIPVTGSLTGAHHNTPDQDGSEVDVDMANGHAEGYNNVNDPDIPVGDTGASTMEAPTTAAPTTEAPTTEAPTTEAPTTEEPDPCAEDCPTGICDSWANVTSKPECEKCADCLQERDPCLAVCMPHGCYSEADGTHKPECASCLNCYLGHVPSATEAPTITMEATTTEAAMTQFSIQ